MKQTVTKTLKFEAGHRLPDTYEGLCRNPHGHSYRVDVTLTGPLLDHHGMMVDFGDIKSIYGPLIEKLDHAMILAEDDTEVIAFWNARKWKTYILPTGMRSTAECMARLFYQYGCREMPERMIQQGIRIEGIRFWETCTCYSEISVDENREKL